MQTRADVLAGYQAKLPTLAPGPLSEMTLDEAADHHDAFADFLVDFVAASEAEGADLDAAHFAASLASLDTMAAHIASLTPTQEHAA